MRTLSTTLDVLLKSYSQILFAENKKLGFILLLASMTVPALGVLGLGGAVFSNFAALAFGLDRQALRAGLFGYHGVLLGLALGAVYRADFRLWALLGVASVLAVCLTAALNYALGYYFRLPALSLPFTLVSWLALLASLNFGYLRPQVEGVLPEQASSFFAKVSAILFQSDPLIGLVLFVGVAMYSRISILLMSVGLVVAYGVHSSLGLSPALIEGYSLPLSAMFAALAVGGIFTVPGPGSVLLAALASVLSVFVLSAFSAALPFYLPPFTVPYNLTVLLLLLVLRLRAQDVFGIRLVYAPPSSPELNLRNHRALRDSEGSHGIRVSLPFSGRWKVTQGIGGAYTHQGAWSFAYDFQAIDRNGALFLGSGLELGDYLSFGKPVLSPADGVVRSVENDVPDNPVGTVDLERNWGNYVIVEHAPGWYSCVAHLKRRSIGVVPGQAVKRGQLLGFCGNSGRSPYPHLHLQFQTLPYAGCPSSPFEFSDVIAQEDGRTLYVRSGVLQEGWTTRNLAKVRNPHPYFSATPGAEWRMRFKGGVETWRVAVDPQGDLLLKSSPARTVLRYRLIDGHLVVKGVEGTTRSGLYLLGSLLTEVPLLDDIDRIEWKRFRELNILEALVLVGVSFGKEYAYSLEARDGVLLLNVGQVYVARFGEIRLRLFRASGAQVSIGPRHRIQVEREGEVLLASDGEGQAHAARGLMESPLYETPSHSRQHRNFLRG